MTSLENLIAALTILAQDHCDRHCSKSVFHTFHTLECDELQRLIPFEPLPTP
jgi:hypothetical protein